MSLFRSNLGTHNPTSRELIERNEITEKNVQKCFNRSMKSIDKAFLQTRPSNSLTVTNMLRNLIAASVIYWIKMKNGTQFKSKNEVHAAICNLDKLTTSKDWIAPEDPLLGLIGTKLVKDMSDILPVDIE